MFKVAWTSLADSARMRNKKADRDKLQDRLDYLFPVTSCPHKACSCGEAGCEGCEAEARMLNCNCKRGKKLPVIELKFMLAMQAHRPGKASMMMTGADKVESERQLKAVRREKLVEERSKKNVEKQKKEQEELEERRETELEMLMSEESGEGREEPGELEQEQGLSGARKLKRNTLPLLQTALAAVR